MADRSVDLHLWRTRIDHALQLQQAQHTKWKEAQWMVEGEWFNKKGLAFDPDATSVNYATAYVRTIVAAIYARNPYIFVDARSTPFIGFAQSMETVLNYLWQEYDLKKQIKRCVLDAVITGLGWIETGYVQAFDQPTPDAQGGLLGGFLQQLIGTGQEKAPSEQGVLNQYLQAQSGYAVRVSPWKVLLAPGYHDIHTMPYLIVIEDLSPQDLEAHPYYRKYFDASRLKPTRLVYTGDQLITTPTRRTPTGAGQELVMHRLYHIVDRRGQQTFTLLEGSDDTTPPIDWFYDFAGFPQVPLVFNELPETALTPNAYPQSDIWPMIPQLRELHWLRTAMVRHRKRSGTVILMRKGSMTEEQKRKLQDGEDVSFVEVDDPTGLSNHAPQQLPPIVFDMNGIIHADLELIGGLSQTIMGPAPQTQRTATEITVQSQGTNLRTSEKVDVIETFAVEVAKRLAAIAWCYYPRERIREILGETSLTEQMWPSLPTDPVERQHIVQREIALRIDAGATQPPKERAILRKQKLDALNLLGALFPDRLKQGAVAQRVLQWMDEKDLNDLVITDDQGNQQAAQQENQLLAQGHPQVVGPDDSHDVHISVHQQGAGHPLIDEHILQHAQAKQAKAPATAPQQGDVRSGGVSALPEQRRQGVPATADLESALGQRALNQPGNEGGGFSHLNRPG